ncbi:MAG TPA: metallophosphoesterase [Tepidisphaeraceae bacterium]
MRTIAHISDIHFGRIDPLIAEGLLADLSGRNPSLLVASGDLTQRARGWQYSEAAEFLRKLPKPQLVVPGNHDVPLYDITRRIFAPLQLYSRHITSDLNPIYRDDEIIVIGLNTARAFSWRLRGFWKDGKVSSDQLRDLQRQLQGLPATQSKIVVTHHPFIPAPGEDPADVVHGAGPALAVMEQCGVDLLLAGHLHVGYSGDVTSHYHAIKRSILSVQAGTATSTRRRGMPNAYNWITIRGPDDLTIEVRAWDGSRFATSTNAQYSRKNGAWQQQQ